MTIRSIVLDAGALDRAEFDREHRELLRALLEAGWVPEIPAVVLAEALTGTARDVPVDRVIKRFGTVPADEVTARRAGALRHGVARTGHRRLPSGIDALVASHALTADQGVVLTTDPGDLRRLLADHPTVAVERA